MAADLTPTQRAIFERLTATLSQDRNVMALLELAFHAGAETSAETRRDAARYRRLSNCYSTTLIITMFGNGCVDKTIEMAERALDAEIASHGVMAKGGA